MFFSVIIVAYNPDVRLLKSVSELVRMKQVKDIIIVNNSTIRSDIIENFSCNRKVRIIDCGGNKGIAYAQNIGVYAAKDKGYDWVLTLDHDTVVSESLFEKYRDFINANDCSNVGILATDYFDIGSKKNAFNNNTPIDVDSTISSGSLINIKIFEQLGGLKIYYFIDQVDNEYCYRLRRSKKRIVVLPKVDMEHRLGNTIKKEILGKEFYLYNQSPSRTYFRTRNLMWFKKEYQDSKLRASINVILCKDFVRLIFEKQTIKKIIAYFKGLYHGAFEFQNRTMFN